MKTRRTTLQSAFIVVAALVSGTCLAKDNATEAGLRAAEIARFQANVDADGAALDRLLDADLEYSHSNGKLDSKSSFIASLKDGSLAYVSLVPTLESVRLFGDVGVIRGRVRVGVTMQGKTSEFTIGYSDVWLWKEGRWQLTEWRSTRLPDVSPPGDMNESGARAAVLARYDAALRGDVVALDRLLGEDLDYCTFRGECQSKQQYIGEVRSGRLKYQSIVPTITRVKMSGENSTVLGRVAVTATRDGVENTVNLVYMAVLEWRDGRWQMSSFASALPYEKKAVR
jgi:ketosteroid isomerase-like protein